MEKAVIVFSGGMDSSVLLHKYQRGGWLCHPVFVDYGQRHVCEQQAAKAVIDALNKNADATVPGVAPLQRISVQHNGALGGSSQTSPDVDVPHGHYTAENMKQTVVPNRNMILLALAVGYAVSIKATVVAYAAHAGDHAIYPDCRLSFVEELQCAVIEGNDQPPTLQSPFIGMSKTDIAKLGAELGTPLELTWSCYEGNASIGHCGKCGTCVERKEAFAEAGIVDPTHYAE